MMGFNTNRTGALGVLPSGGGIAAEDASLLDRQFKSDEIERRDDALRGVAPTFWADADAGDEFLVILSDGTKEIWEFGTPPVLAQTIEAAPVTKWQDSVDAATYEGGDWVRVLSGHTLVMDMADDEEIRILLPETYAVGDYTLDTNTTGVFLDAEGVPLTGLYNTAGEYRLIREGLDIRVLPVAVISGGPGAVPSTLTFAQGEI